MQIHNREIGRLLEETADLLEIRGANEFRVRAYRNGVRALESLSRPAWELLESGENLTDYDGIGESLEKKIREIVSTGSLDRLEALKEELPPGLLDLLEVPELGPRRVATIYRELGITTLDGLEEAIATGRLAELSGFGEKLASTIGELLEKARSTQERMLLPEAGEIASALVSELEKCDGVDRALVAGSYRRQKETVGDLDILVTGSDPGPAMERFLSDERVEEIRSEGETRSTAILAGGVQVDLRFMPPESFGAALIYFTGSKAHNLALRRLAAEGDRKVSEYGLFEGDRRLAGSREAEVYETLGLEWIAPELREGRGEIEAAQEGRLPDLLESSDIRGDLHAHTTWSDGAAGLEEMADAAEALGYEYLAITDHSPGLTVAGGLSEERLEKQLGEIERINRQARGCTLLASMEVNINRDGSLDLSGELLERLDLAVCSIHSSLDLPRDEQTERLLRAIENPGSSIIGHPTGRRFPKRDSYRIDLERVARAAAEQGVALEINGQPERLDLNGELARLAAEQGALISLSTDAHAPAHLEYMRYAVGQARRGWLTGEQVLNTRPLELMLEAVGG